MKMLWIATALLMVAAGTTEPKEFGAYPADFPEFCR